MIKAEPFTPKLVTAFREGYGSAELRADLVAGLTLAIVALPLAMALGITSAASPREGLVTAIIAGIGAATVVAAGLGIPGETVGEGFHTPATGLPLPRPLYLSLAQAREVLSSAFVIAFLAGIEALLSATVADGMTGRRHRSGQELVGMGVANIVAALLNARGAVPLGTDAASDHPQNGTSPLCRCDERQCARDLHASGAPFGNGGVARRPSRAAARISRQARTTLRWRSSRIELGGGVEAA